MNRAITIQSHMARGGKLCWHERFYEISGQHLLRFPSSDRQGLLPGVSIVNMRPSNFVKIAMTGTERLSLVAHKEWRLLTISSDVGVEKILFGFQQRPVGVRGETIPEVWWVSYAGSSESSTHQMACSCPDNVLLPARLAIKAFTFSVSSTDPLSNPRESWKINWGLFLNTNWFSMSRRPRWWCQLAKNSGC